MAYNNVDYEQGALIVTNPTNITGQYRQILCLTDCIGVTITDENLLQGSEAWSDAEFIKGAIIVGRFTDITLTGKVVIYV